MSGQRATSHAPAVLLGPVVWAVHFLLVYVTESLFCARSLEAAHTLVVIAATGLAIGLILWRMGVRLMSSRRLRSELDAFLAWLETALCLLAVAGVVLVGAAGGLLPACR